MRHGKQSNHLSRTASHRGAMLSNMASSLIKHKRISTTVAKAKVLRKYIEPLITKAKTDTTHSRRVVFSYLQDKEIIQELFSAVAEKVTNRPGGYTRIIKTVNRLGDNAEMCMMELVDFNELMLQNKPAKTKIRRSRRGGKKSDENVSTQVDDVTIVEEIATVETTEEVSEGAIADQPEASSDEETPDISDEEKKEGK